MQSFYIIPHITCIMEMFPPTLRHRVRLYVSIVVLAGPNEASLRFHGLGHHVIYQTVLIPNFFGLELSTVFPGNTRRWTVVISI